MALRKKDPNQFFGRICIDGSLKQFIIADGHFFESILNLILIQYKAWKTDKYVIFEQRTDGTWNVLTCTKDN